MGGRSLPLVIPAKLATTSVTWEGDLATVEIGAFAQARGDRETVDRCNAQAAPLAPLLP